MKKPTKEQDSFSRLEGIRLFKNMHRFNQEEKKHLLGIIQSYFAENPDASSTHFVDWFLKKHNVVV